MYLIHSSPGGRVQQRSRRDRQRGLTLIELMISLTIGLVLVAGLALLFSQQSSTQAELEKSSRQIENGRYAMQMLREDLQLAGYYGEFYNTSTLTVPGALPDPCVTLSADLAAAMPFPVQGYDAPGASLPTSMGGCPLNAANHLDGTDILVIRHAETDLFSSGLTPGQVYLQSGLTGSKLELKYQLAAASATTIDTGVFTLIKKDSSVAPLRKYSVHVYYISPCSVPTNGTTCSNTGTDDGGVSVPTLKRLELSSSGGVANFTTVPLVEGIENMQIDYGFDASGDGAPDCYVKDIPPASPPTAADCSTAPTAVGDWVGVMALRVHLLARNNERSAGYKDDKTYNLGLHGSTLAANDSFKRHVFSQTIRLVNPSARRDQ